MSSRFEAEGGNEEEEEAGEEEASSKSSSDTLLNGSQSPITLASNQDDFKIDAQNLTNGHDNTLFDDDLDNLNESQRLNSSLKKAAASTTTTVSYTHLTLPTILRV